MINKYNYLSKSVSHLMEGSDKERIDFLYEDHWIGYDRAINVINNLKGLLERPKKLRPQCLLIVGDSNMGKTTIIQEFIRDYYIEEKLDEDNLPIAVLKPVIAIQAPAKPNTKELFINILDHFFVPYKATDPEVKLRNQVIHLMRKFETRILIIDELHNFLSGTPRQQQEVMNTLKVLSNELRLNIVGVGTREAILILHTDAQYASRFDVIELPKWKLDTDFLRLLLSYVKLLPLKKESLLGTKEIASLLWEISEGNLGDLNKLIIECAKEAIASGTEEITVEIISKFKWLKPTDGERQIRKILMET